MYIRHAQYTRRALVITQFNTARAQVSRLCRSRVCVPTLRVQSPRMPGLRVVDGIKMADRADIRAGYA